MGSKKDSRICNVQNWFQFSKILHHQNPVKTRYLRAQPLLATEAFGVGSACDDCLAGGTSSSHDFTASWTGLQYVFFLILDAGWYASGIEGESTEPSQGPDGERYVAWFPALPTDAIRKLALS